MSDRMLKAAEEAVAWAKRPFDGAPAMNNYRMLYIRIQEAVEAGTPVDGLPGNGSLHWSCLSRLLILDDPTLVGYIKPHYIESLDCQAGATMLCVCFKDITGRPPKVRSWRVARQEVDG